jgi:hypothetical protein
VKKRSEAHAGWTQFYAGWFSPSNRYPLSRQAQSEQLKELADIGPTGCLLAMASPSLIVL